MAIPVAYSAKCIYCAIELDVRVNGVFQRVSGWAESRQGGGTNTVALPEREPLYACKICIGSLRKGRSPEQGVLWKEER